VPDGLSVDSSLIAIEAVQRGEGVMLGRRPFIDYLIESAELVEVFSESCRLFSDYYLRRHAGRPVRPEIDVVANWIRQLASESWPAYLAASDLTTQQVGDPVDSGK
jgi:DNA-binding transcriptional LysR family regulator